MSEDAGHFMRVSETKVVEANYFFRMSQYQEQLLKHLEDHPEYILPSFRRAEVLGFLKQPL